MYLAVRITTTKTRSPTLLMAPIIHNLSERLHKLRLHARALLNLTTIGYLQPVKGMDLPSKILQANICHGPPFLHNWGCPRLAIYRVSSMLRKASKVLSIIKWNSVQTTRLITKVSHLPHPQAQLTHRPPGFKECSQFPIRMRCQVFLRLKNW